MNESTCQTLKSMMLIAMAVELMNHISEPEIYSSFGFEDRLWLLVDAKWSGWFPFSARLVPNACVSSTSLSQSTTLIKRLFLLVYSVCRHCQYREIVKKTKGIDIKMKKRILFIADGIALAHTIRSQYLLSCLSKDKYQIYFAASSEFRHLINDDTFTYIKLDSLTVGEYGKRLADISCKNVYDDETVNMCIHGDKKIINNIKPAIVVGDVRMTLGIVCRQLGIPYINIQNAYYSPYTLVKPCIPDIKAIRFINPKLLNKVFDKGFTDVNRNIIRSYNKYAVKYGVNTVSNLYEFYSNGDLNLFLDTPTMSPTSHLTPNQKYIGPILSFSSDKLPSWWNSIKNNKPIIYCSIGSTGDYDKINKVTKVLKSMDIAVILVTAGRSYKGINLNENFYLCDYIPALKAIELADLVIYNGGSGTLYQALSMGKPVLALPTLADQFFASSEIDKLKVGKSLRYRELRSQNLNKLILDLLNNPIYKSNSKKIASEIKQYNSKLLFQELFDEFINQF